MNVSPRSRRWPAAAVLAAATLALGTVAQAASGQSTGHAAAPAAKKVSAATLAPGRLRADTLRDPIGLGDVPRLSWIDTSPPPLHSAATVQAAYQIRVASTASRLGHPDRWNSGKVASGKTNNIAYRGAPLHSRERVVWDVRVWDARGRVSAWSAPGSWEMGLLKRSDWSAQWIDDPGYTYATNGGPNPLPVFAKAFHSDRRVAKARLYITGLGQYAARMNGRPVTKAVLEPGQTSYWNEVDYRTYEVTGLVRPGSNVLGIETGSGVYQQADSTSAGRYMFQPGNNTVMGAPKVIAQLEITYADGAKQTIPTNSSWRTELGPTTFSSWWGGEDYDARRIPADWTDSARNLTGPRWQNAAPARLTSSTIPRSTTPLVANPRPPVTVARVARPVRIRNVAPPADQTTLVAPITAGATNVKLATVTDVYPGDTIRVGIGSSAETRTVTAVGTAAGPATTLAAPAAAGATNVKVTAIGPACNPGGACTGTASFIVGQSVLLGTGAEQRAVTVTAVGTAGAAGTGVTVTPALSAAVASGTSVRSAGTGITVRTALHLAHADATPVTSVPARTYVLDFGANLSGLPQLVGSAPAGSTVTMIPAEEANPDGTVNIASTGATRTSQILYSYTFAGHGPERWHAQFTYSGLRYLEVHGLRSRPTANTVTLLVTHAANRPTASFTSSSSMLNSIYAITKRALDNNMQSVLTDCPDREKGPYTGDNVQNIDTITTLYDVQAYERQLVANIRTSQRPTPFSSDYPGLIANIEPEYHALPKIIYGMDYLDDPNWAKAVAVIPWQLYRVYGDTRVMRENYDAMVKWLEYEATNKAENQGNIPGLGDWAAGQHTDPQPVIDYGYYVAVKTVADIARVLGKTSDAARHSALAAQLADEYNAKYLHTDSAGHAWYANNTEASNAVALDAGLVPEQYQHAVVRSLIAAVHAYGDRIGTGSVALGPLFRTLHAANQDELIYRMVTNPAAPSYAYLVNHGATTLEESLDGTGGSKDHQFLGEVASWMVHDLVGIAPAPGSTGYRHLLIKPSFVDDLKHAAGTYTTPQGRAVVSWTRTGPGSLRLRITIPANTTATVWIPVTGGARAAPRAAGTHVVTSHGERFARYPVGAGTHQFSVPA